MTSQNISLITAFYTCLDWQFQYHKMLQVNQYGALQNLQNLSNIIVFQNYETFNNLAHGEFGQWLEKIEINQRVANQFMKVASEIPNSSTYSNLGYNVLYLIATLLKEEFHF